MKSEKHEVAKFERVSRVKRKAAAILEVMDAADVRTYSEAYEWAEACAEVAASVIKLAAESWP